MTPAVPILGDLPPEGTLWAFCDGGVWKVNPSPVGGAWAVAVFLCDGPAGQCKDAIASEGDFAKSGVSNNVTETMAATVALEIIGATMTAAAGAIQRAVLFTDSNVARLRVEQPRAVKMDGYPTRLRDRLIAAKDLIGPRWPLSVVLVAGHPTRAELKAGYKVKPSGSLPVHRHNVLVDELCKEVMREAFGGREV